MPLASSQPHFIILLQLVIGKALYKKLMHTPTSFFPLPCPGLKPSPDSRTACPAALPCQVMAASLLCTRGRSPETPEPQFPLLPLAPYHCYLKLGQNKSMACWNTPLPELFTSRGFPQTAATRDGFTTPGLL